MTSMAAGILNPAELHRQCVKLEHQIHLLEKKLAAKDNELRAVWAEAKKMETAKAQVASENDHVGKELALRMKELAELNRTCQELIADRTEWRGREVAMQRKAEGAHQREVEWRAEEADLQAKNAKLEDVVKRQDQQIQLHLTTRQQIARRMDSPPSASVSCQTEALLDEQNQVIVAAESVATAGLTEARALRVELQQAKRKIARLEASSARANEACAAYKSGCETLQEEIEHLSKEVSQSRLEHQEDRQKLLAQLRASEARERELHESIEGLRRRDLSVEDAKREVERLTGQEVDALRAENNALREESRGLQETSLAIREEFEAYQQKYIGLMRTLQQVREQSDEHRRLASDDIQALNRENAEVFDDYNRVRQERQDTRAQLTRAEDRIKQLLNEKEERLRQDAEPQPKTEAVEKSAYDALAAQLQDTTKQLQETETDASAQKATVQQLQNTNAHLTTQVNLLMKDVQEMRRAREAHRESEAQKMSASATERENLEKLISKLEVENQGLKYERDSAEDAVAAGAPSPSPQGAGSPPTRLQALAASEHVNLPNASPVPDLDGAPARLAGASGDAAGGNPFHKQQIESVEGVVLEWGRILNKLLGRAGKLVGVANKFRCYLAAQTPHGEADACSANAVPMIMCTKYPTPAWNKLFEAFSAIKLCIKKAEEYGIAVVAQNVVLQRQVARLLAAGGGGGSPVLPQPLHAGAADAYAPQNSSQQTHPGYPMGVGGDAGVAAAKASQNTGLGFPAEAQRHPSMLTDIERAVSRVGGNGFADSPSEAFVNGGAGIGGIPVHPNGSAVPPTALQPPLPPIDHDPDTDSESSSAPGEDLAQCTSLIHDTDVLLRASQGAEAFWGEARIEYLTKELQTLQKPPPPATPPRAGFPARGVANGPAAGLPAGEVSIPPLSPVPAVDASATTLADADLSARLAGVGTSSGALPTARAVLGVDDLALGAPTPAAAGAGVATNTNATPGRMMSPVRVAPAPHQASFTSNQGPRVLGGGKTMRWGAPDPAPLYMP